MKAVLHWEGASIVPNELIAKKCFRFRLSNGQIAGTVSLSDDVGDRGRDHLVRVSPSLRQAARWGAGEVCVPVNVYGAVHHSALVLVDDTPLAFAYIECIKSSANRLGASGLAERRRDTECFSSLGRAMRYVIVLSIDAVVGTLFVRDGHVLLYTREVFSTE